MYTDGLTEARRPGDRKFFPLLERTNILTPAPDVQATLEALVESLAAWTGGNSRDDVALIAVQRPPPPG